MCFSWKCSHQSSRDSGKSIFYSLIAFSWPSVVKPCFLLTVSRTWIVLRARRGEAESPAAWGNSAFFLPCDYWKDSSLHISLHLSTGFGNALKAGSFKKAEETKKDRMNSEGMFFRSQESDIHLYLNSCSRRWSSYGDMFQMRLAVIQTHLIQAYHYLCHFLINDHVVVIKSWQKIA